VQVDSNRRRISHRFRDMVSFPLEKRTFSYYLYSIPKTFSCTTSLKFCVPKFKAHGKLFV